MVGGGGYAGSLSFTAMRTGLDQGYATATTDTGHDASVFPLATFAYNDPKSERDYASRAVHETVITAKELIESHYGKKPKYNYWVGCSTGGRQGLMEAQRFPDDFDGLIVGAPVLEFTDTQIGGIWNAKALTGAGAIPVSKLPALAAAELAECDGVDGLVDGQITDPRQCNFDPSVDLPKCANDVDGPACFTTAQREALKKVYDGPRTSSGRQIFPGYAVGTAVFGPNSGWIPWFVNPSGGPSLLETFGETFMQYMAFREDPGPTYVWENEFNFDIDPFRMQRMRRTARCRRSESEEARATRQQDHSVPRLGRPGAHAVHVDQLLRARAGHVGSPPNHGLLQALHGPGHVSLQWWARAEHV